MSAAEKLEALEVEISANSLGYDVLILRDALPEIIAVVKAAERRTPLIAAIRALGFVGNAHYCADCLNHFHEDRGQHEPGCSVLADLQADDEWWSDQTADPALSALDEALPDLGVATDSESPPLR